MNQQTTLELKGTFQSYPLAELLVEILAARLSGSLRLSHGAKKTVIYFREGSVAYAVSNARSLRLFSVLMSQHKIDRGTLAQHPTFANDIEFGASLVEKGVFSKQEIDQLTVAQMEAVIIDGLGWVSADWLFTPLARSREDLVYNIDAFQVLVNYARCVPPQMISQRFKSVNEAFEAAPGRAGQLRLQAHESYILARFEEKPLTIEELRQLSSLPEALMLQALYVLWLGGALVRRDWNAAFSANKIGAFRDAKVSLVKSARKLAIAEPESEEPLEEMPAEPAENIPKAPAFTMSLDEYLERVESAQTLYDVLAVESTAEVSAIKRNYFAMAKLFHPDRYHRLPDDQLRRIQSAFTELAHAYETLKSADSRESYDFKVRRELESRAKVKAAGNGDGAPVDHIAERGLEAFEIGVGLLAEEDFEAATVHLARAVHISPQNAIFHAYYGKALSADKRQRHKAEAEMQTAVRLDPKDVKIRLMLAEFFVELNLLKRAEGELKRFLEIAPGNKEATAMLASLQK